MRVSTRLALGAMIMAGIVVALIVVLARTDDAAVAGPSGAGYDTPTPTHGPACPGAPSPPGGTCPPCPTSNVVALESTLGVYSTCWPLLTPTPTPNPSCAAITDVTIQCTLTPSPTPTFTPNPSCPFVISDVGVQCSSPPTPSPTPTPFPSLTPCPTVSPTNCDVPQFPAGDADCDFGVDLDDVTEVLRDSAEVEGAQCPISGNAKCDDGLNALDALLILQHLANTNPQLPAWCRPFA